MPEEKIASQVAEEPAGEVTQGTEVIDKPEVSDKAAAEPEKETAGKEVSSEAQEIAEGITPGSEEEQDETDEVDEILAEPKSDEEKSNVQRRIDKLTAELKTLREDNERMRSEKIPEGKKKYTNEQLGTAMMKAVMENDSDLMTEIIQHIREDTKQELVEMYNNKQKEVWDNQKRTADEWNGAVNAYSKYADTKVPEIYPGSHKDLNLKDGTSLLYQVALALYWSDDEEKAKYYRGQSGGQKLAVADALNSILAKKASKSKKPTKSELKDKRKSSIASGGPGAEEKPLKRPMTDTERLDDVINERKKYKSERGI